MAAEKIYTPINEFFSRNGRKIVNSCILLYIIIFCLISYLKYSSFSYNDIDLYAIERTFWNTIHGNFVTDSVGEATIFNGGHPFLIIFLLAPLYAVYPHPLTLLFMQSIVLACPAYFVFRIARDKIDPTFATYFALAYLLYPALAFINLFEFHIIAFAPLFLIPTFIFFEQRRFWPFILLMLLALACREDVSLVIVGIGVYAALQYVHLQPPFIKREDWKWILTPLLSGALWFIIATQFIQPYFTLAEMKGLSDSRSALGFYGWLGSTPGEMIKNLFLHPIQVLRGISIPAKNTYLLHLLGPLAFLSVFGLKEIIVVLFALLESLLSQRATHFSIHYQYSALVMPFIFISAIFGLKHLLKFKFFKRLKLYVLIILFGVSLFSAFKIGPLFRLHFDKWKRDQRDVLKEEFVKLVPLDAAVATSFELGVRLTHRDRIFSIYHINRVGQSPQYSYLAREYGQQADYLLVDFFDQLTYFGFYYRDSDMHLNNFLKSYNWNPAYEINNIALLSKADNGTEQFIQTVDSFPAQLTGPSASNGYIKLAGCQLSKQKVLNYPVLRVEAYLECQKKTDQRFVLALDFYSKDEKELLYQHYFIAADRIYPSKRWQRQEKIKIVQNVLVPSSIQIEDCRLGLSFALVEDK